METSKMLFYLVNGQSRVRRQSRLLGIRHKTSLCTFRPGNREPPAGSARTALAPETEPGEGRTADRSQRRCCDVRCSDSIAAVTLARDIAVDREAFQHNVKLRYLWQGFDSGVGGRRMLRAGAEFPRLEASTIRSLPAKLREWQAVFDRAGGLHAAGLFFRARESGPSARRCRASQRRRQINRSRAPGSPIAAARIRSDAKRPDQF